MGQAKRLIDKHGIDIDLVIFTDNTVDPAKPWKVLSETALTQSVKAVFLNSKRIKSGKPLDFISNDGDISQERRVLIAAEGLENKPNIKGELRYEEERWAIVSIIEVAPSRSAIIYLLQVRQ